MRFIIERRLPSSGTLPAARLAADAIARHVRANEIEVSAARAAIIRKKKKEKESLMHEQDPVYSSPTSPTAAARRAVIFQARPNH